MLRSFLSSLTDRLITRALVRGPDFVIGRPEDPYLRRWYLVPRNRFLNVYLHHIVRSDQDPELHSHPWLFNLSIILRGWYCEETAGAANFYSEGDVKVRFGPAFHRLNVPPAEPCWTLFITGPKVRTWSFRTVAGFVPWFEFVDPKNPGQRGRPPADGRGQVGPGFDYQ